MFIKGTSCWRRMPLAEMASARFLCVLICVQILSFAFAAPPIRPVASNSITLNLPSENTTDSHFTEYDEIRISIEFTDAKFSFPHPLPDPYTYEMRGPDFEYDIIFSRTSLYLGLSERQIGICMTKAILMASHRVSRDPDFPFSQLPIIIYGGPDPGDVEFQILNQLPRHPITWGDWAELLVAIDRFTREYPGRGFLFQVRNRSGIPVYGAMH